MAPGMAARAGAATISKSDHAAPRVLFFLVWFSGLEKLRKNANLEACSRNGFNDMSLRFLLVLACGSLLLACSGPSPRPGGMAGQSARVGASAMSHERGNEVVLYALGLLDTGYRFGGKNPEAGLDCSGMVSYIYREALGFQVSGSAADLARRARIIERTQLQPGDLVFFNTRNQSFSHVGVYIGDERFVHAPSTNGRIRIDRLGDRYYAQRFERAATFFD